MNKLLTEKYQANLHNYFPLITEIIDDEKASQIIEWQKDKIPIHGFYRHKLETETETFHFYSACADVIGFINAKNLTEKPSTNGKEDRTETTGPKEVQ